MTSDLSDPVSQFFLNGGTTAWIVRVAAGAAAAAIDLEDAFGGGGNVVLTATAVSAGTWANNIRVTVDHDSSNPASLFNSVVAEAAERNGRLQELRSELHRNLSMNSFAPKFARDAVNASSNLIRLERPAGLPFGANGTASSAIIEAADLALLGDNVRRLAITLDGGRTYEFDFMNEGDPLAAGTFAANMTDLAARIETAVRALEPANPVFSAFTCTATVSGTTAVLTATSVTLVADSERSSVAFSSASRRNAAGILSAGLRVGGANRRQPLHPSGTIGTAWICQARPSTSPRPWPTLAPSMSTCSIPRAQYCTTPSSRFGRWRATRPADLAQFPAACCRRVSKASPGRNSPPLAFSSPMSG